MEKSHLCGGGMDTPEILPLAQPLGTKFWCGMWTVTVSKEERVRKGRKEKREGRQGTKFWTCMLLELEARDWMSLRLPTYEINMMLYSQAFHLTSLSPPQALRNQPNSSWTTCVAGVLGWGTFSYEKWALGKSTGDDEEPGECQTFPEAAPDTSWPVKVTQAVIRHHHLQPQNASYESRCVPPWVAPLCTNSWLSQIHNEQAQSMERLAGTLGCWSWGLQNLQHYFWRIQFPLDIIWLSHQMDI